MTDYGHELAFGTFLTPQNQDPQTPVRLAQVSEAAGLDLVTFQDHPYQPGFLDTWTLLSWVAAQTERVTVSGNVLNLPLRPRRCWPAPRRRSTCCPAAGSRSASARAPSGTRSSRWAAPA
ncbi:hypothetical protein GCM10027612_09100 [Microbispora bryophytorum subsp. camponoti]